MQALILVADGFEDRSLFVPMYRLREEGYLVRLASPHKHAIAGRQGYRVEPDLRVHDVNPGDFDLLVIPDGSAAEKLRLREDAVGLARTMGEDARVAAIGHGPQLLLSAGLLDGRIVACSPGIRDDVRAAGAAYRDEPAVLDGAILTGRGPDDLPEFCRGLVRLIRSATRP
jgi:protease I